MEEPPRLSFGDRWKRTVKRIPLPLRLLAAGWMIVSLAFNAGLPSSTDGMSSVVRFIVLLPMALVSLGLGILMVVAGGRTLFRASRSIFRRKGQNPVYHKLVYNFIGCIAASQLYLIGYMLVSASAAERFGNYTSGVALSCLLTVIIAFGLLKRGPHPADVKIFLWVALGATLLFGIIMATVAVPPT